ncbi:hypothetical protein V6N13_003385 [Hibiscus sabdariffa]
MTTFCDNGRYLSLEKITIDLACLFEYVRLRKKNLKTKDLVDSFLGDMNVVEDNHLVKTDLDPYGLDVSMVPSFIFDNDFNLKNGLGLLDSKKGSFSFTAGDSKDGHPCHP